MTADRRKTVVLIIFGLNGPSGAIEGSPFFTYGSDISKAPIKHAKCTINCRMIETHTCEQKIRGGGRSAESFSSGSARETKKNSAAVARPAIVICTSPALDGNINFIKWARVGFEFVFLKLKCLLCYGLWKQKSISFRTPPQREVCEHAWVKC